MRSDARSPQWPCTMYNSFLCLCNSWFSLSDKGYSRTVKQAKFWHASDMDFTGEQSNPLETCIEKSQPSVSWLPALVSILFYYFKHLQEIFRRVTQSPRSWMYARKNLYCEFFVFARNSMYLVLKLPFWGTKDSPQKHLNETRWKCFRGHFQSPSRIFKESNFVDAPVASPNNVNGCAVVTKWCISYRTVVTRWERIASIIWPSRNHKRRRYRFLFLSSLISCVSSAESNSEAFSRYICNSIALLELSKDATWSEKLTYPLFCAFSSCSRGYLGIEACSVSLAYLS